MKILIQIVVVSFLSMAVASFSYATDVQDKQKEVVEKQQQLNEKQKELNHERRKESMENAKEANKSMQQVSRASKIIGARVTNSNGENLGDLKELVLNPESGQVVYAVVSFGGVLGLGNKLFAVPWKALRWTVENGYYILNVDKNTLAKAPGFDKKHWPDSSDKWDQLREEINQFYHVN